MTSSKRCSETDHRRGHGVAHVREDQAGPEHRILPLGQVPLKHQYRTQIKKPSTGTRRTVGRRPRASCEPWPEWRRIAPGQPPPSAIERETPVIPTGERH